MSDRKFYPDEYHKKKREEAKKKAAELAKRIEAIGQRVDTEKEVHQTMAYNIRRRIKVRQIG